MTEDRMDLLAHCGIVQQLVDEFEPHNEREKLLLQAIKQLAQGIMIMAERDAEL